MEASALSEAAAELEEEAEGMSEQDPAREALPSELTLAVNDPDEVEPSD